MHLRTLAAASLIVILSLGVVYAQTETGQITGTVLDQSGAAVPNVTITVRGVGTGVTRTVTSAEAGTYTVTNLLPGEYVVSSSASGFAATEQRVTVAVGSKVGLDLHLE